MNPETAKLELEACKRELENEKEGNSYRWIGFVVGFAISFAVSFICLVRFIA